MGVPKSYLVASSLGVHQSYLSTASGGELLQTLAVPQSYLPVVAVALCCVGLAVQNDLSSFVDDTEDTEDTQSPEGANSDSAEESVATSSESTETQDGQDEETTIDDQDGAERGVIYARVSSQRQVDEGNSLREQVSRLKTIADRRGIELVAGPVRDKGETGSDFDREGIQRVTRLAADGEIAYVLVDDIDRIGRHAIETTYYLYELRNECGVTIITASTGEVDIATISGLLEVVLKSLSSQMANENRTRRSHVGSIEKYERKNWSTFFDSAPLGYTLTDEDWLRVDPEEAAIARDMFQTFLEVDIHGAYQRTVDEVSGLDADMTSGQVKRLLRKQVYIGVPTVNTTHPETQSPVSRTDKTLQLVEEETFNQVQDKIKEIQDRYSTETGSDSPDDLDDLTREFGTLPVSRSSDWVTLSCEYCGGELVKNGQRKLSDRRVHNYKCTECGAQRKFPTQEELERMKDYGSD